MADESPLAKRVLQLEIRLATATSDQSSHAKLCDARWGVIWKLAGVVSGIIALAVSVIASYLMRP